jgi:hypothetical protein
MEDLKEKENHDIKECTFTPILNRKSLRMFASRANEYNPIISNLKINSNY